MDIVDAVIPLIGLALAVAALVPALTTKDVRKKVIYTAVGLSLVLVFAYNIWRLYRHDIKVDKAEDEIVSTLAHGNAMTFDQLNTDLYFPEFNVFADAIDDLITSKKMHQSMIGVKSATGSDYRVRVYYTAPNPHL